MVLKGRGAGFSGKRGRWGRLRIGTRRAERLNPRPAEVIYAVPTAQGVTIARVQLHGFGTPRTPWLKVVGRGDRWRLEGTGYGPVEAWQDGERMLALVPEGDARPLQKHDRLVPTDEG